MAKTRHQVSDSDSDWLKYKWAWVEALVQDRPTRGLAHDIGFLLARRYLHADKGRYAWVGLKTLAKELGVARTSIIRAFDKLMAAGWLVCEAGGKGAGDSNHYYLPERIPLPVKGSADATLNEANKGRVHAQKGSRPRTIRVASTHNKGSVDATQREVRGSKGAREEQRESAAARRGSLSGPPPPFVPFSGPPEERDGIDTATQRGPSDTAGQPDSTPTRRKPSGTAKQTQRVGNPGRTQQQPRRLGKPFPDGWVLGNDELAVAHELCGWDLPTALEQFDKFQARCADQNKMSHDWAAAWRKWCHDDRDYNAKHPQRAERSSIAGILDWGDGQKVTEH